MTDPRLVIALSQGDYLSILDNDDLFGAKFWGGYLGRSLANDIVITWSHLIPNGKGKVFGSEAEWNEFHGAGV